ncbi:prevent-host-death family protein [Kineosphaera limosa]|uniref:Antitoxin n=1 Tax=Kineosphaera limosa NBRC 100340 TaxID=1184609 RepID=K6VIQ3_9MICO|nr:type II toxin-antitoxin system prevent-host-death family antitoxin [Kineosphaera limosa]NYE01891.1 prevent-host-death family protein [Kineosphaera limosa]GAB96118.1 putative prevent-host-death family protein [Kineosphaera limosa NBRC 100340]
MKTVKVAEAKARLSAMLAEVEAGGEFVIARGGTPVARLVPLAARGERELGFVPFHVPESLDDPLPESELAAWEGDGE